MALAKNAKTSRQGEVINLRTSRRQKALIDRAAEALGTSRSDFMLQTACREAEIVLLDRCYFELSDDNYRHFTEMLDHPPKTNLKLKELLLRKAPWDK